MRTRSILLLGCAVMLIGVRPARAQDQPPAPPTAPDKSYTLEAKFAVGDLLKYKMQMNSTIEITTANGQNPFPGGEMTMNAVMRMKTTGIKPDGTAVVAMQMQNGEMTMMGNTMAMPETPAVEMEIDRRGMAKMRNAEKLPGGQMLSQLMNFNRMPSMGVILPDHPVKVGDTWEAEVPFPMADGKVKAVCTLMGVETVGGKETVKIKQVMTIPFMMRIGKDGQPTQDAANAMMNMTGKITFNSINNALPDTMRLVKTVGDFDGGFDMEMQGDAAQQSPFGSSMKLKMAGKMTMTLTSAEKVTTPTTTPKPGGKK